jgi:hypothetical protein
MNAAVPIIWDLNLRLEHKLQTAMRRQRVARPQFRSFAYGLRITLPAALRHWCVCAGLRLSCFTKGVGSLIGFGAMFG